MKKFFSEFKAFALRGNVMDLAVGMIIGAAFTDIVKSLIENFITPVIKAVTGAEKYTLQNVQGFASNFLGSVLNFILLAFILFLLIKGINKAMALGKKKEEENPTTKVCEFCKSEISIEATRCPHCTSELSK